MALGWIGLTSDLEPAFFSARIGFGLRKLRKRHKTAIFRLCQHRSPERAGEIADVGYSLCNCRARALPFHGQRNAPLHGIQFLLTVINASNYALIFRPDINLDFRERGLIRRANIFFPSGNSFRMVLIVVAHILSRSEVWCVVIANRYTTARQTSVSA